MGLETVISDPPAWATTPRGARDLNAADQPIRDAWEIKAKGGPLKPGRYDFKWRSVTTNESLKTIAAEIRTNKKIPISGRDLAEFNFDTRKVSEINWYLRYFSRCQHSTEDGENCLFTGGLSPPAGIWVPKKKAASTKKSTGKRGGSTVTVRPQGCRERKERPPPTQPEDSTHICTFKEPAPKGGFPACRKRPGDVPARTVEIKEKWEPHTVKINSMTHAFILMLSLTRSKIEGHALLKGKSYTYYVTTLQFQWAEETVRTTETARAKPIAPKQWPLEKDYLVDPEELKNVAATLSILRSARLLDRVIIRGYADHSESRSRDPVPLSEARAQFVKDQLAAHYGLAFATIPVVVIGCGSFYAPPTRDLAFRAVEVEAEVSPRPEPPGEPREFTQVVPLWRYYEYDGPDPTNFSVTWRSRLLKHYKKDKSNKWDWDFAEPERFELVRKEALSYVDLFEEVFVGEIEAGKSFLHDPKTGAVPKLETMRQWIASWEPPVPHVGIPSLRSTYNIMKNGKPVEKTDPPVRYIKNRKGELEKITLPRVEPAHTVIPVSDLVIEKSVGGDVQTRIRNAAKVPQQVHLSGMRVHFNGNMPPGP